MKGKVLPYPAEVKTETFSEKYDGPTARLTKSFETGDPMRKGCSNSNKGDYNFEALAASNQTIAYSPLTAVHENKKTGFKIRSFPSQRLRLRTTVLNYLDSNQERQNQNLLCYHYTTAQSVARKRDKDKQKIVIYNRETEKCPTLAGVQERISLLLHAWSRQAGQRAGRRPAETERLIR